MCHENTNHNSACQTVKIKTRKLTAEHFRGNTGRKKGGEVERRDVKIQPTTLPVKSLELSKGMAGILKGDRREKEGLSGQVYWRNER